MGRWLLSGQNGGPLDKTSWKPLLYITDALFPFSLCTNYQRGTEQPKKPRSWSQALRLVWCYVLVLCATVVRVFCSVFFVFCDTAVPHRSVRWERQTGRIPASSSWTPPHNSYRCWGRTNTTSEHNAQVFAQRAPVQAEMLQPPRCLSLCCLGPKMICNTTND